MSDREKLIPKAGTLAGQTMRLADHLIANGVTVQQWHSAKTPKEDAE